MPTRLPAQTFTVSLYSSRPVFYYVNCDHIKILFSSYNREREKNVISSVSEILLLVASFLPTQVFFCFPARCMKK